MGAGATYNLERYTGLQQSHEGRFARPAQFNDPLRNWTSDAKETVHYFSIYATPPRIGRNTEVRFSYDFSHADASNLYTIPAGSPIPTPNQLPNVFNKLQQLHIDARHRLTSKLAATFSYLYEPLKIYDYAFDPSVVNGIVQPSSLVMGYVYRPYTAHSVGVRHSLSLVGSSRLTASEHGGPHAQDVVTRGLARWRSLSSSFRRDRQCAGRRAGEEGRRSLRRAEVLDLPRHRGEGRQVESARRRRARSSRPTTSRPGSSTPIEAAAKAKSTKKPPMPAKYGKLPAADIDALVAYMQSLK